MHYIKYNVSILFLT